MSRQNLLFFRSGKRAEAFNELEAIRLCIAGDQQAFEGIVEKYRDSVFWTAYHLVLDYEDARDVAQQCFLKLWQSLATYDTTRPFAAWVTKIAANAAIDFLRTRKRAEVLVDVPLEKSEVDLTLDMKKIFRKIAPLLPERQRITLVLREINGMEIPEIAQMLDCTESTVRNLLSQARASFRKRVKELFPEYGV